jgi:photosystem II stability/assembly factor-like uncharacterized protein
MKKILLIIIINCSLLITNCLSQWVLQNTGTNNILNSIQFVNSNTGWAVGDNALIIKTTNGGLNWVTQQSNLTANRLLTGIDMLDENTGYMVGWFSSILKTTNGGDNWIVLREAPVGQGNSYNDVDFINDQTGWFCGFLGNVWKTTNGGVNWDSVNVGGGGPLRCIQFLNSQTGWVAGDVGYIRKTTNGGLNWFFQFFGTTADYWYNSLCFINVNTGWVVGYNNAVYKTTNSGNNWDTVSFTPGMCLYFVNDMTGWTGRTNGNLYKSTNGGYNWYLQSVPVAGIFIDIFFINDSIGWAANYNKIIKTTNGGEPVAIIPINNYVPDNFKLYQNFPNPFNSVSNIKFDIIKGDYVKIEIYDALGELIETLVDQYLKAGTYEIIWDANNFSSGVYFYRLTASNFTKTNRMILSK